jgi:hypothetical protein
MIASKSSFLGPLLALWLVAGCSGFGSREPAQWDGLVQQRNARLGALFVKPGADVSSFHNVLIDPVEVRFAQSWDPNRSASSPGRRLDARDLASIQTRLAELTRETFAEELGRAGYAIVEAPGYETLRLTVAIVDLSVTAPDTMAAGRSTTFTADAGRATLVLELRDSVTGEVLARAVDTRTARGAGPVTLSSRTTNTAAARRVVRIWASGLRQALTEMYAPRAS